MIKLRGFLESDFRFLNKWINDPDIIQFTNIYRPISEIESREWFDSIHKNKNSFIFAIALTENDEIIGTCGLYDYESVSGKAELRMKIGNKEYWNKGVGKTALNKLLEFGFSDVNLRKIWLRVFNDNERAIKLYEDAGFIKEGLLMQDVFIKGKYKDVLIMSLNKKNG